MATRALTIVPTGVRVVHRVNAQIWPAVTLSVGVVTAIAVTSALVFAIALVVTAIHAVVSTPEVRAHRADRARRKRRRQRRERRAARFEDAATGTVVLDELADIVDEIVERDPRDPFELEALLDRYVDLAISRQRCRNALLEVSPTRLTTELTRARQRGLRSAEVLVRRIAQLGRIDDTLQRLDRALAEIAELVRYWGDHVRRTEIDGALDVVGAYRVN